MHLGGRCVENQEWFTVASWNFMPIHTEIVSDPIFYTVRPKAIKLGQLMHWWGLRIKNRSLWPCGSLWLYILKSYAK